MAYKLKLEISFFLKVTLVRFKAWHHSLDYQHHQFENPAHFSLGLHVVIYLQHNQQPHPHCPSTPAFPKLYFLDFKLIQETVLIQLFINVHYFGFKVVLLIILSQIYLMLENQCNFKKKLVIMLLMRLKAQEILIYSTQKLPKDQCVHNIQRYNS